MTRDPAALHIGLPVITPNGRGVIRAHRFAAGLPRWLVLDYWWSESQLTVPAPPAPVIVSARCQHDRHHSASDGCGGGVVHHGQPIGCACWCHGDSDKGAGQAYNRGNRTAPEDACDVDEGLTTNLRSQEGAGPQC